MGFFAIIICIGMKKILLFAALMCIGTGVSNAAVRGTNVVSRTNNTNTADTDEHKTASPNARNVSRRESGNVVSRATSGALSARDTARTLTVRSATNTAKRTTEPDTANTTARSAVSVSRTAATTTSARSATTPTARSRTAATPRTNVRTSRAAINRTTVDHLPISNTDSTESETFGTAYNTCRDAYFTCMDQFCAMQNESYRRCVCSSRLTEIQEMERALGQTADQIADFVDLNLEVIPKTGAEVKAMLSASEGEYAQSQTTDKSASAQQLAGISDVLNKAKSQSLSTAGTLDIAGNINQIWATTDLASGAEIANLTGEPLYNAVHSQCAALISDMCPDTSTLSMVVSAYGMYIENDCTVLSNALQKQRIAADDTIRATNREMNAARLENYNAHNSTEINECIAQVRRDITADAACGRDYVHCLDITGRYLNRTDGEPIYTPTFFQLENQTSLDGDILNSPTNRTLVDELNRKRIFAERGLETCRDLADVVWDEFVRQAITEIYQGQQERVRTVKNECLDVVNTCYDEQNKSLRDFSNIDAQLLLGQHMELSEELCQDKLYACANLYGEGEEGLQLLVTAMTNITDQTIAQGCRDALTDFLANTCAVPNNDSQHAYPYGCRMYAPGDQRYASIYECNKETKLTQTFQNFYDTSVYTCRTTEDPQYAIENQVYQYESCGTGYAMFSRNAITGEWELNDEPELGNQCLACSGPNAVNCDPKCGKDYTGSLYQKVVRYALNACVRPSDLEDSGYVLPSVVLQDINVVMDKVRADMAVELAKDCERYGGTWVDTQYQQENAPWALMTTFYNETSANTKWGYCHNGTAPVATTE